jgi:hypothetical protein
MAHPSVFFIANERDECITLFNSQTTPARMKNIQKLLQDMNKKTDPETAFKNLNQGGNVLSPNYAFRNIFYAISGR